MSKEFIRDELSEEVALYEAWDAMHRLQEDIDSLESPDLEDTKQLLLDYQQYLWKIHNEYIGKEISISGSNIAVPLVDDTGNPNGQTSYEGIVSEAYFSGISVAKIEDRYWLGIKATTGYTANDSLTYAQNTTYSVFAPLVSTSFTVPSSSIPEISPDDDDETAQEIDQAILNVPIDLARLTDIIQAIDPSKDEMKLEMYLRHINSIASFESVAAIAPYGFRFDDEEGDVSAYQPDEDGYIMSGDFSAFRILFVTTEEGREIPKLVITCYDEDDDLMGVMTEDIAEIQLR